jgi:hypothetical protein
MAYRPSFAATLLTAAFFCVSSIASAQVSPYFRLAPYGQFYTNWSTFGDINPYTQRFSSNVFLPSNYGDEVFARPYFRSAPDGNSYNNVSTYPNVNRYNGRMGTRVLPPADYGPDFSAEGSIATHTESDPTRSAPPADRLKSRVRRYTNRPTYQIRFEPNTFARP